MKIKKKVTTVQEEEVEITTPYYCSHRMAWQTQYIAVTDDESLTVIAYDDGGYRIENKLTPEQVREFLNYFEPITVAEFTAVHETAKELLNNTFKNITENGKDKRTGATVTNEGTV